LKEERMSGSAIELPTIGLAAFIYGGWAGLTFFHAHLPIAVVALLGAWLIAWHSSLQHELLHGHPTRWPRVNHGIGFVPLSLWLPMTFTGVRISLIIALRY
jgi:fatty acid desaturase